MRTDLRSDDNEAMRSDMENKLRVKGVIEKVTMEEQKQRKISSFNRRCNQKRFRRWNCKYKQRLIQQRTWKNIIEHVTNKQKLLQSMAAESMHWSWVVNFPESKTWVCMELYECEESMSLAYSYSYRVSWVLWIRESRVAFSSTSLFVFGRQLHILSWGRENRVRYLFTGL